MLRKPPFKGPFKGKGAALRYLLDLEDEHERLDGEMARLVAAWKRHGGDDTGLRLLVHTQSRGSVLRWRSANTKVFGRQRYLDLFDPACEDVLSRLAPASIRMLVGYEHTRSLLNARARAVQAALREFRAYKRTVEDLERRVPELRSPPVRENAAGERA